MGSSLHIHVSMMIQSENPSCWDLSLHNVFHRNLNSNLGVRICADQYQTDLDLFAVISATFDCKISIFH